MTKMLCCDGPLNGQHVALEDDGPLAVGDFFKPSLKARLRTWENGRYELAYWPIVYDNQPQEMVAIWQPKGGARDGN